MMKRLDAAVAAIALWGISLAAIVFSGRVLYADGAWFVLQHLVTPHRFNDYDAQRTFASFISQAPVLLGQRLGLDGAAAYAALYAVGIFVIPAVAMMAALWFARRELALFAAVAFAIALYGFGANFINSEANLLFGFAWLAAVILALDRPAPVLRSLVLPLLAVAMLRMYEGMLLVGPVLALWAALAAARAQDARSQAGLTIAAVLFAIGAAIGLGGFVAPRDAGNAGQFASSALRYLGHPHAFLLLSAALATASVAFPRRAALLAGASALAGAAFVVGIARVQGFMGFELYYFNRSFLVLSLPLTVGALFATWYFRPQWLRAGAPRSAFAVLLVPIAFAVAGDLVGTWRWSQYVSAFCDVLGERVSAAERYARLAATDPRTGWSWTQPSLSVVLRGRDSRALVANAPTYTSWQPFELSRAPATRYRGLCTARPAAPSPYATPIAFTGAARPAYVAGIQGLSGAEPWGTWSEGPRVTVEFREPLPRDFDVVVQFAAAYGPNADAVAKASAGGREVAFRAPQGPSQVVLEFRGTQDARSLAFDIPQPVSPFVHEKRDDHRPIGLGFRSIAIEPAN